MLPFEFVIEGPPVSQQTRRRARRQAWVDELRRKAMPRWPVGEPPTTGAISVAITHIFVGVAGDLDNLAKPVLDALKGLVYEDDRQVTDLTVRKRDLARGLRAEVGWPEFLKMLNRGGEFLHVLVQAAPDQEVIA
jgi:Holliday junction resolvase RusA-like endonuclease